MIAPSGQHSATIESRLEDAAGASTIDGMRKHIILLTALALSVALTPAAAASTQRPTTYIVSRTPGDQPEGISITSDETMYVTSVGTGAVFRGNVHDPDLHPFIAAGADGRGQATGVHVDRWGRIFVAGYDTGTLYVYNRSGRLLAKRPTVPGAALNDFAFSADAVYVTDSVNQIVWRASLTATNVGPLQA
jgi:sugar lactone lactonase YvrE